ncbi:hypothetical protein C8A00DRAFT_17585 [Chaetomidium leptoderma]|uniref:5'-3' DNA helicase ZGRF1-like N-terminal domain-containing protein n=1 Tax=Chaetomidium leptoderma TaxID=669021 RepID=A0AAN6VGB2_9PEZI|nr:hypothetical protein C8A00DRAFT_17585 [Chaetomidium leptoderma]
MPSMMSSRPGPAAGLDPSSSGRTAPVIEFVCLFTRDLRRKQKRWEDGRLKYHTFNKRVMVYDERGNNVGDMHWQREYAFDEGEEVQLERGGVIVQVMECVGRQEQDLSELLDKRAKEKEERQARVAMRPSLSAASPNTPLLGARSRDHFQTRHKPLNHLLGTPTGHHGRAVVPTESPFELRQRALENTDGHTDSRPSKRRKCETSPPIKMGYAQNLFGATLTLSAVPVSSAPPRRPIGPAPRAQPEVSSPREEVTPNVRPVREDRRLPGGAGLHASSSGANAVPAPSRMFQEPDRRAVLEDQEPLETTPSALGRPRAVKAIPGPQRSVLPPPDANDYRPTSSNNDKPPTGAVRPTTAFIRSKQQGTAVRHSETILRAAQTDADSSAQVTIVPQPGVSRSQAIVLDEDHGRRPDVVSQISERHKPGNGVAASKRGAPSTTKPKPTKRNKSPKPAAQSSVVKSSTTTKRTKDTEEPPMEERTELRLKPRQKRGLLLLSEKRTRTKQPKRQDVPVSGLNTSGGSLEQPTKAVAAAPNLAGAPIAGLCSTSHQDHPFASSSATGDATPAPGPPSPQLIGGQPVQRVDGTRSESMDSVRKASAQAYNERGETSSLDLEEPSADVALEPVLSRPSRQTRKGRDLDDQGSSHARKKARKADSDASGSEELPRAPVRPRLARLSRKSIRSKELIGFVPSSPPVISLANPVQPPLGARGSNLPEDDAAAATCLIDPRLSVSTQTQLLVEKPNVSPPPMPLSRAAPPALQRHNSLPDGTAVERMTGKSSGDQAATCMTRPSDDSLSRRGLARSASVAVFQPDSGVGNSTAVVSALGSESIVAPEEEAILTPARPWGANQERPVVGDNLALRVQLHNNGSLNLSEQPEHPINDTSSIGLGFGVTERANKHLPVAPTAGPTRPKIMNPATRGRKAALKSDAAGQVPQSIVPVEPVPAHASTRPLAMPRPDPAVSERPKRKMKFPGFTSVKGGGPWSREAHDLLESARPS